MWNEIKGIETNEHNVHIICVHIARNRDFFSFRICLIKRNINSRLENSLAIYIIGYNIVSRYVNFMSCILCIYYNRYYSIANMYFIWKSFLIISYFLDALITTTHVWLPKIDFILCLSSAWKIKSIFTCIGILFLQDIVTFRNRKSIFIYCGAIV